MLSIKHLVHAWWRVCHISALSAIIFWHLKKFSVDVILLLWMDENKNWISFRIKNIRISLNWHIAFLYLSMSNVNKKHFFFVLEMKTWILLFEPSTLQRVWKKSWQESQNNCREHFKMLYFQIKLNEKRKKNANIFISVQRNQKHTHFHCNIILNSMRTK